jgi:DnaJ-class molecular chaperone
MSEKDYYEVLGVDRGAPGAVIKEAYRKLAFEYHPDRNREDPSAVERMKEINEAYAVLSDTVKRQRYDTFRNEYGSSAYDRFRQGYSDQDIFRGSDINQIFEEMAKTFGFRHFDDVFRESYGRSFQTYHFSRPGIFGKFIVIRSGQGMAQGGTGSGEARSGTGLLGRLVGSALQYLVQRALGTSVDGVPADRKGTIDISEEQAGKGGKVAYLDPETSREVTISVPADVREGQVLRLKGMGGIDRAGQRGDLYLTVHVKRSFLRKVKGLLSGGRV